MTDSELLNIIILTVVWVIAFVMGWHAREKHAERVISRYIEQAEQLSEEDSDSLIRIAIEKHNDAFYVYSMDDKTFMAQGQNRKELEAALEARYPGKKFAASPENLMEVGLK